MTPFAQLTHRNYLIAAHDALATVVALVASLYLRFQSGDHDQFDDGDDQRGRGKGKQRDRDDHGGQNKRDHERGNRRD